MTGYGCVICFALLIVLVISRAIMMKKLGLKAIVFGKTNKSDFLLPPIVLFFVYHLIANAFDLPKVSGPEL